ncbi:MAG: DUF2336 domain-containing protein [Alphaproteobacteria bacterium]
MAKSSLSMTDVERLMQDSSVEVRASTAAKVAQQFGSSEISTIERELAVEICRTMLGDAAVMVRSALSENLKNSPDVPREMALKMAADVDAVALPILTFSEVLTDDDLVEIIAASGVTKQVAIAHRPAVGAVVSEALVATDNEDVVAELVANEGADIGEETFRVVLDRFADSDRVKTPMVHRKTLPVSVAERLVHLVSEKLQEHMCSHHDLPMELATDLVLQSRERATMSLSGNDTAADLVKSLAENGRLTASIVTRAVCMGDMPFFEWAMATISRLPIESTRKLIYDRGPLGLTAIFDRSGLPDFLLPVLRTAVDVGQETSYDGLEGDRERFVRQMIERVITKFDHPGQEFDPDTLEYLLKRVQGDNAGEALQ